MRRELTLSRKSRLYRYVFGEDAKGLRGFPEPTHDTIPCSIFLGLAVVGILLRILSNTMISLMSAMFFIISFLIDGSIAKGSLLKKIDIVPIEPWPRIKQHRFPPWVVLVAGLIVSYFLFNDTEAALGDTFWTLAVVFVMWVRLSSDTPSLSAEISEAIQPATDGWLRRQYKKQATLLPVIRLII